MGAGFNRDYWARFERFVQDLAKRCDDVWVSARARAGGRVRCRCARAHAVGCTLCVLCLNCCPASLPGDSQLAPHILPAQPWQLHPPYSDPLSADCDRPSVPAAALAHAAGDRRARLPHAASHDWCARRSVSGPHDALALVRSAVLQCATRHVAAAPPNPTPGPSRAGTPPQLMAVPSHYFKVVLGEYSGGRRAAVGAFVMPNAAIDPEVPLASFAVPIGALEEVAGGWRRARGGGGGAKGVCFVPKATLPLFLPLTLLPPHPPDPASWSLTPLQARPLFLPLLLLRHPLLYPFPLSFLVEPPPSPPSPLPRPPLLPWLPVRRPQGGSGRNSARGAGHRGVAAAPHQAGDAATATAAAGAGRRNAGAGAARRSSDAGGCAGACGAAADRPAACCWSSARLRAHGVQAAGGALLGEQRRRQGRQGEARAAAHLVGTALTSSAALSLGYQARQAHSYKFPSSQAAV